MIRTCLVVGGLCVALLHGPLWAGTRRSTMTVSCTVIGRIALTYQSLEERGMLSSPGTVSRAVPDAQLVRYQVNPGVEEASVVVSVRSITNLRSNAYRLMATLVSADPGDEWEIDGVRLVPGQATPVAAALAYGSDGRYQIRVRTKDSEKTNAGAIRFQVLPE